MTQIVIRLLIPLLACFVLFQGCGDEPSTPKSSTKAKSSSRPTDSTGSTKTEAAIGATGFRVYSPARGVSGTIKSVGSDTMNNLMALWGQKFKDHYPAVKLEVEGKGSSTAPPALIKGTATFGPMSRAMKNEEIDKFKEEFGYPPVQLASAIDMLAVYVHKDNPIAKTGLTKAQIDAIFSKSRRFGYRTEIKTWGDVGLTGEWASAPISIYGRNSASGTYGFFKKKALGNGDYKDSVKEQPGSSAVVASIAGDKFAIGYSGLGYKTADVATVAIAKDADSGFIPPNPEKLEKLSDYPLTRALFLSLNYKPNSELGPLIREFLRLVYSDDGQEVVLKDGYLPVTKKMAEKALKQVGISSNR